jgi:hypothetical protein
MAKSYGYYGSGSATLSKTLHSRSPQQEHQGRPVESRWPRRPNLADAAITTGAARSTGSRLVGAVFIRLQQFILFVLTCVHPSKRAFLIILFSVFSISMKSISNRYQFAIEQCDYPLVHTSYIEMQPRPGVTK